MSKHDQRRRRGLLGAAAVLLALAATPAGQALAHPGHAIVPKGPAHAKKVRVDPAKREWLAGDHHVHSWYSASAKPSEDPTKPPTLIKGGDGVNPITTNAQMAAKHGLAWMVATDHGGPDHARMNRDLAYPELVRSRKMTPSVLQFWGMELDTPAAEHSSVIIPRSAAERDALYDIEHTYNRREPWPAEPVRDTEGFMLDALRQLEAQPKPPLVIANHPSRTAKAVGVYGAYSPAELRGWNDTAPQVAVGMEGAPGHQAAGLTADGGRRADGERGGYGRAPTMGGFDQMTARLGGFWDSMLGEGRRFWVTSTSDSHRHYTTGGEDFWPGEYSKTYVKAVRSYDDVLDGLRNGRGFVTLGDLVSAVDFTATTNGKRAEIGGELKVAEGADVTIVIRVRDPKGANFGGVSPDVARIDLIRGDVTGPVADRSQDTNPSTHVVTRFTPKSWAREGEMLSMVYVLKDVKRSGYVRIRGTNGEELEPQPDPHGENPWTDLWFYANPIFITVTPPAGAKS
ncbi:phosphoesterase [Caulobacter sp. RHG1]|uniref:phosphoesterase n=1 Tax=Caulobacter sp. (strain RHG1) TaxID=2545762 RepID=UPI00155175A0|nr:phosphoesterase [Caulobacter sp. RHG1]NQE63744.1 Histidinol phosphatase and related hydrolases of the PHP family [Caulobacter sp. RHG1]